FRNFSRKVVSMKLRLNERLIVVHSRRPKIIVVLVVVVLKKFYRRSTIMEFSLTIYTKSLIKIKLICRGVYLRITADNINLIIAVGNIYAHTHSMRCNKITR